MKILLFLSLIISFLVAEKVEVSADSFEADENRGVSKFIGNVKIKKADDFISSNELIIEFDKKNKPEKYIASKNIKFKISTNKQKFEGKANRLIYQPSSQKYELLGDVKITEKTMNRKLFGDKIIIDRVSGKSKILGTKNKPVKFIFTVEE
jgi:lipopolysaccharide export system protein LptA